MATTTSQRLSQPQISRRAAAATAAGAALVLACAAGLAVLTSPASVGAPAQRIPIAELTHAAGRGFLPGLGSYTVSTVAYRSQASGYASGKGGLMEGAGLEMTAAEPATSQPRGGTIEAADVR